MLFGIAGTLMNSQPSLSQSLQLEEVIVTATRRAESLQDVPIAISVFNSEDLEASGIQTIQDLEAQTPGLTVTKQAGGVSVFLRGIGAIDNSAGQESAVATYVDGVYIPSLFGALFSFNNIDRVEVLKGPQGTLFGRNATGGLVHVITKDPSHEPQIKGSLNYGNYDTIGGNLYGTVGLSETVAADMALLFREQGEGYGRNITTGKEVGFLGDEFGLRGKFLITPSERTSITFTYDYYQSEGDIGSAKNSLPGSALLVDGSTYSGDFYNARGDFESFFETDVWGTALTVTHEFDNFDVKSITSYRDMIVVQQFDNDLTEQAVFNVRVDEQQYETVTQEFQVTSKSDSSFSWIIGAFFLHDESGFGGNNGLGLLGRDLGTGVQIKNKIETTSYSIFGESKFTLTDQTNLTAGIRWTNDEREISGRTEILDASSPDANVILTIPAQSANFDEGEPSWRLVLEHSFTEDVMLYGSYNRGFKSGNFTTTDASSAPFQSEKIDAYEIGLKSQLLENRLQLNAAVFFYDYTNLQVPNFENSLLVTSNAGEAEIKGIDFDAEFLLTERLRLRFGGSYLDTEYTDYSNSPCSSRSPDGTTVQFFCDATGNKLVRSPELTYNMTVFYNIPSDIGDFDVTVAYAYNDGFPWETDNRLKESSYNLMNAEISWTSQNGHLGASVFAKNLLDEEYSVWSLALNYGDMYTMAPPRTYGVELKFSF